MSVQSALNSGLQYPRRTLPAIFADRGNSSRVKLTGGCVSLANTEEEFLSQTGSTSSLDGLFPALR